MCAFPTVIYSIFGKSFHFAFPYFVLFVLWYFPFHVVNSILIHIGVYVYLITYPPILITSPVAIMNSPITKVFILSSRHSHGISINLN